MKLFKRVLVFATFGSVFIYVYRNCEKRGIQRYLISFRIAIIITLTGILGIDSTDRSDPITMNNDRPPIEKMVSNQEFNTLEDSHNSGITVQTGNGTILTFQQKAHDLSLNEQFHLLEEDDSQVILVKAGNSTTPTPPNRGAGPNNFPVAPPSGGRPSRPVSGVNPSRTPPKVVDQGLGGAANPAGAGSGGGNAQFDENCPVPKKEQSQESKTFDYDYRSNSQKKK